MEVFFSLFIFIAISVVVAAVKSSAAKTSKPPTDVQRERDAEIRRQIAQKMAAAGSRPTQQAAQGQRQQATMQRSVMQKADMSRPADGTEKSYSGSSRQRPIIAHDVDDCTGGSIHDGYHEGVSTPPRGVFSEGRTAARSAAAPRNPILAGTLGVLPNDDDSDAAMNADTRSYVNVRKTLERLQKLPPLTQGIVFAEILGKPRCEQY